MNNIIIPDILNILQNNKLDSEYNVLKELEETIIDLYDRKLNSDLFNNHLLLLLEIPIENKYNIKFYEDIDINTINMDKKILDNLDNIVFTGSYIRKILLDKDNIHFNTFKNELFVNCINNINPSDLTDQTFTETNDMYYKKINDITIYVIKQKFKSPSEVILMNYNLKRIGFYLNKLYCSSMFIADYNRHIDTINSNLIDPIFNTKLDIFDVHNNHIKKNITLFDLINKKNFDEYKSKKIDKYDIFFTESKDSKEKLTPIEYTIKLYVDEQNDIIKTQLKLIIMDLLEHQYQRPPIFYAYLYNLEEIDTNLYDLIKENKLFKNIKKDENFVIKNINDINNIILKHYIINDNSDEFYNYLKYINDKNIKLDNDIFNLIIQYDPKNIIITGIKNNFFSDRSKYKIILWTQNLDYFNIIGDDFKMDIALNFINDIVENCLIKSFYFLYKIDNTLLNTYDMNNNNFLHNINEKNKYKEMITLLLKLDDSLLFKKNKFNESPLIKHAKQKNYNILSQLIDFVIESNNDSIFEVYDINKNNILHYICSNDDNINLVKKIVLLKPELINMQNKSYETPIIVSAKNNQEDYIYFLKGNKADMNICDIYGNSVYHYICLNELCIGMAIENKENIFGYKPSDYCKISQNYYYFV
jgi:hypothetical protein